MAVSGSATRDVDGLTVAWEGLKQAYDCCQTAAGAVADVSSPLQNRIRVVANEVDDALLDVARALEALGGVGA